MVLVRNSGRYGYGSYTAVDIYIYKKLCAACRYSFCGRYFRVGISCKEFRKYMAVFAYGIWNEFKCASGDNGKRIYSVCYYLHIIYSCFCIYRKYNIKEERNVIKSYCRSDAAVRFFLYIEKLLKNINITKFVDYVY